jgi:hypothetical protein
MKNHFFPLLMVALVLGVDAHAQEVEGTTIEYEYDARDVGKPQRAWWARAYLHPSVVGAVDQPRPVVLYLHGVNKKLNKYIWMGGEGSPDLRIIWDGLLREKRIAPAVLIAPSSITACTLPTALWEGFDLDRFLSSSIRATRDQVRLDLSRVIVVGHSGAGCNPRGGMVTAVQSVTPVIGALTIDPCMDLCNAEPLARAHPNTGFVITYQRRWQRDFDGFTRRFLNESRKRQAVGLRLVQELWPPGPNPHNTIVQQSLERWLPRWIPPSSDETSAELAQGGDRE